MTSLQYLQHIFNPVGEQKFSRAEFVRVLTENAWNRDKAYEALTKNAFQKFQQEKDSVLKNCAPADGLQRPEKRRRLNFGVGIRIFDLGNPVSNFSHS